MWEGCAPKGQDSAHILPQKEERRTESWVLFVGVKRYKYSKQHDSMPALFSHFSCKEHVYDVFISCHRLMSINLNSSSSHFPKTLYFNECHKVSITAHGSQCLPFISDAK